MKELCSIVLYEANSKHALCTYKIFYVLNLIFIEGLVNTVDSFYGKCSIWPRP